MAVCKLHCAFSKAAVSRLRLNDIQNEIFAVFALILCLVQAVARRGSVAVPANVSFHAVYYEPR